MLLRALQCLTFSFILFFATFAPDSLHSFSSSALFALVAEKMFLLSPLKMLKSEINVELWSAEEFGEPAAAAGKLPPQSDKHWYRSDSSSDMMESSCDNSSNRVDSPCDDSAAADDDESVLFDGPAANRQRRPRELMHSLSIDVDSYERYKLLKLIFERRYGDLPDEYGVTLRYDDSAKTMRLCGHDKAGLEKMRTELETACKQPLCKSKLELPMNGDDTLRLMERTLLKAGMEAVPVVEHGRVRLVAFSQTTADCAAKAVSQIGQRPLDGHTLIGKVPFGRLSKIAVDEHFDRGTAKGFLNDVQRRWRVKITSREDRIEVRGLPTDVIRVVGEIESQLDAIR